MKNILLNELKKESFPDFSIFLQEKSLKIIPDLLEELLQERKNKIKLFLKKKNNEIQFDDLIDKSLLSYLRKILNHLDNVENNSKLRNIVSNFRPKMEDFYNELSYSKKYYEKILRIQKNLTLNDDQKRILELRIKDYKNIWIELPKKEQLKIK